MIIEIDNQLSGWGSRIKNRVSNAARQARQRAAELRKRAADLKKMRALKAAREKALQAKKLAAQKALQAKKATARKFKQGMSIAETGVMVSATMLENPAVQAALAATGPAGMGVVAAVQAGQQIGVTPTMVAQMGTSSQKNLLNVAKNVGKGKLRKSDFVKLAACGLTKNDLKQVLKKNAEQYADEYINDEILQLEQYLNSSQEVASAYVPAELQDNKELVALMEELNSLPDPGDPNFDQKIKDFEARQQNKPEYKNYYKYLKGQKDHVSKIVIAKRRVA